MEIVDGAKIKNINGGRHFKHCIEFCFTPQRMAELREYVEGFAGPIKKKWRFHIKGMPHRDADYTNRFVFSKLAYISFADKRNLILFKLAWEECSQDAWDLAFRRTSQGFKPGQLNIAGASSSGKSMFTAYQMHRMQAMHQAYHPQLSQRNNATLIYDYESSTGGYPSIFVGEQESCWLDYYLQSKIGGYKELEEVSDSGKPSNFAKECLPWVNRRSAPLG